MQGTNYVNFIGRYCWVAAGEHGLTAVEVTERDEPQAVIGSQLHSLAFPDDYRKHLEHGGRLEHRPRTSRQGHQRPAPAPVAQKPEVLAVQTRGEYLYAACGEGGLRVFDIAFIDDKGFSERITTAPVSPLGQKFYVPTKYATAVAAPTTHRPRPDADAPRREPRADGPRPVRLHLRGRQVRGADPGRRRHAARRQPAEQLPQARPDVQPRRPADAAPAPSPSSAPTPTSAATPAWWSSRSGRPEEPAGDGGAGRGHS